MSNSNITSISGPSSHEGTPENRVRKYEHFQFGGKKLLVQKPKAKFASDELFESGSGRFQPSILSSSKNPKKMMVRPSVSTIIWNDTQLVHQSPVKTDNKTGPVTHMNSIKGMPIPDIGTQTGANLSKRSSRSSITPPLSDLSHLLSQLPETSPSANTNEGLPVSPNNNQNRTNENQSPSTSSSGTPNRSSRPSNRTSRSMTPPKLSDLSQLLSTSDPGLLRYSASDLKTSPRQQHMSTTPPLSETSSQTSEKSIAEDQNCRVCDEPITDQYYSHDQFVYHPEHWRCTKCQRALGNQFFVSAETKPLCLDCSQRTCAGCKSVITDETAKKVDGKYYHNACWRCHDCQRPLANQYQEVCGKALCGDCGKRHSNPVCKKCHRPILDQFFLVGEDSFHTQCFEQKTLRCVICNQAISGEYLVLKEQAFHESCLPQNNPTSAAAIQCAECLLPITQGSYNEVRGKHFHTSCFRCSQCSSLLTGNFFPNSDNVGKYDCPNCFTKKENCAGCGLPLSGEFFSVSSLQKKYHTKCFKCTKCFRQLQSEFYSLKRNVVCRNCAQ